MKLLNVNEKLSSEPEKNNPENHYSFNELKPLFEAALTLMRRKNPEIEFESAIKEISKKLNELMEKFEDSGQISGQAKIISADFFMFKDLLNKESDLKKCLANLTDSQNEKFKEITEKIKEIKFKIKEKASSLAELIF